MHFLMRKTILCFWKGLFVKKFADKAFIWLMKTLRELWDYLVIHSELTMTASTPDANLELKYQLSSMMGEVSLVIY